MVVTFFPHYFCYTAWASAHIHAGVLFTRTLFSSIFFLSHWLLSHITIVETMANGETGMLVTMLTLSQTSPGFYVSVIQAISPFTTVFSTGFETFLPFSSILKLSSVWKSLKFVVWERVKVIDCSCGWLAEWCFTPPSTGFQFYHGDSSHFSCLFLVSTALAWGSECVCGLLPVSKSFQSSRRPVKLTILS